MPEPDTASAAPPLPAGEPPVTGPGLTELFLAFCKMSLSGFGGVLPWARRTIVEERRWMTAEEFNEAFSLSQFLPGPNIVNFSVVFGSRFGGPVGAALALIGLMGPPVAIVIVFAVFYARFGDIELLRRALGGIAASAAGLIIAVTAKMAGPMFRLPVGPAPFVAVAAFVAIGILRWPLVYVLATLVPVSIALAFWRMRRA
jgi:chromate transporter